MKGCVTYKGERIARNSDAYALWEAKDFKALDRHMKDVNQKAIDRGEIQRYGMTLGGPDVAMVGTPARMCQPTYDTILAMQERSEEAMLGQHRWPAEVVVDSGLWERLKKVAEGIPPGEIFIITGGRRAPGKSMMNDMLMTWHRERQDEGRRNLRVEMVKARALPGDSGLTVGDIHASPQLFLDTDKQ